MNLLKKCRYGMMVYNNSDIYIGKSIENYGEFSECEVKLFRECLTFGGVVADVGANIGCHTLAFSRLVGETGFVFAYEPERYNFYTLCANLAINNLKNVYAFHKALGCAIGRIAVPELDFERTVNFGGLTLDADYTHCPHYDVELGTLDDCKFKSLDFVKIDVEGMEKVVLDGATETIERLRPILYVENDRQEKSEELLKKLKSMNYIIYEHQTPLYNFDNYYEKKENLFLTQHGERVLHIVSANLFCHHADKPCPINPAVHHMRLMS